MADNNTIAKTIAEGHAADAAYREWVALTLTPRQGEALKAAYTVSNGWLERGRCRIWGIAPMAIHALVKKGYLEMPHGQGRARLTPAGRSLMERLPS